MLTQVLKAQEGQSKQWDKVKGTHFKEREQDMQRYISERSSNLGNCKGAFPGGSVGKNLPAEQEMQA